MNSTGGEGIHFLSDLVDTHTKRKRKRCLTSLSQDIKERRNGRGYHTIVWDSAEKETYIVGCSSSNWSSRRNEKKKGEKRKKEVHWNGRVRVAQLPADSNCASRSVSAGRAGSKIHSLSLLSLSLYILFCIFTLPLKRKINKTIWLN